MSRAQDPIRLPGNVRRPANITTTNGATKPTNIGQAKTDTTLSNVERRDYSDDSLKVKVYFFSSSRVSSFDTSIRDYTTRFPIPATHVYLSNDGSATRSLLFSPRATTGWDPGFHSFDVYKLKPENVRFFNTPKPYTELGYMLAPTRSK